MVLFICLLSGVRIAFNNWDYAVDDVRFVRAKAFLEAALQGDENTARTLLSSETQLFVSAYCPDRQVTQCIGDAVPDSWGDFDHALFGGSHPRSQVNYAVAFDVVWSNNLTNTTQHAVVVVIMTNENGDWLVQGWNGFLTGFIYDADVGALLDGRSQLNQFPPSESS
jgi:hypothetical protein